jgi:HEAT repeat protein/predicted RNA-binding Zn-ribbon protein involved in translation (DUF1610 family)
MRYSLAVLIVLCLLAVNTPLFAQDVEQSAAEALDKILKDKDHAPRAEIDFLRKYPYTRAAHWLQILRSDRKWETLLVVKRKEWDKFPVYASLRWLHFHQDRPEGRWDTDGFSKNCKGSCGGESECCFFDVGASSLALLTFLGNGDTHRVGKFKKTVRRGFRFLLKYQQPDGKLLGKVEEYFLVQHALATASLVKAYAATRDGRLEQMAQKAVAAILSLRNPDGGWGDKESEIFATAAALMALDEARIAGFKEVRDFDWKGALEFARSQKKPDELLRITKEEIAVIKNCPKCGKDVLPDSGFCRHCGKKIRYTCLKCGKAAVPGSKFCRGCGRELFVHKKLSLASARAARLYCLLIAGESADLQAVRDELDALFASVKKCVEQKKPDHLLYFLGAQAAALAGPEAENKLWTIMEDAIEKSQCVGGCPDGSWDPNSHIGRIGGRIVSTCLMELALQKYEESKLISETPVSKEKEKFRKVREAIKKEVLKESPEITKLIKELADDEWRIRKKAAARLGKLGPEALPQLCRVYLETEDAQVKNSIGKYINNSRSYVFKKTLEKEKDHLENILKGEFFGDNRFPADQRVLIKLYLANIGISQAQEDLDYVLGKPVSQVCDVEEKKQITRACYLLYYYPDASVRLKVRVCLEDDIPKDLLEELVKGLSRVAADDRLDMVKKLANYLPNGSMPYLAGALDDKDPDVVKLALELLEKYDGPEANGLLVQMLAREGYGEYAAARLSNTLEGYSVPALLHAAACGDKETRPIAIKTLCSFDSNDAFNILVDYLDNPDENLKKAAREALAEIAGKDLGADGDAWIKWKNKKKETKVKGQRSKVE